MSASLEPTHGFTPEQQAELEAAAIPVTEAPALGIRSAPTPDDLPDYAKRYVDGTNEVLPAMVFTWTSASGRTVEQVKPVAPVPNGGDTMMKYLWPKGEAPVIHLSADPADPALCLVVEGTKQCRAAALYAPPNTRVVGLGGCFNWMEDGITSPELEDAMEGLPVVVILDADMYTNTMVFEAATRLDRVAKQSGAESVKFARMTVSRDAENTGLDDYLGSREPSRRATRLKGLIESAAKLTGKMAPTGKTALTVDPKRPLLDVDDDPLRTVVQIIKHTQDRWDGTDVFDFGGIMTEIRKDNDGVTITHPMKAEDVDFLIHRAFTTVDEKGKPATVPPAIRNMVRAQVARWTTLEGVVRNPFVRPDGTVCTTSGYDPDTRYLVALSEDLEGLYVPEDPEPEEVAAAVKLLTEEWLGDFPFHTKADRANALAFIITAFIRGSVDRVPMAVIDGLQMGVGKGVFVDCVYCMLHGHPTAPTPWSESEEEQRKVITALFRSGTDLFVYDEAHSLSGKPLSQAITAATWQDRLLGVSDMVDFPNNVIWAAMGNNVAVHNDMRRRVYRIRIEPTMANPESRPASSFRHPLIKEWTLANRAELLRACLTIVRSWYANGAEETTMATFGSFEKWQTTVGSILDNARVDGFLMNLRSWLDSGDSTHSQWMRHYEWLIETYPDATEFTASEAARALTLCTSDEHYPPNLERGPDGKVSARKLGQMYGYQKGKIVSDMRLGKHADDYNRWYIERLDPLSPMSPDVHLPEDPPAPVSDDTPEVTTTEPVVFDLETHSGDDLYTRDDMARLTGYDAGDGVVTGTDADQIVRFVEEGRPIVAHNLFGFDAQVLAKGHGLDILAASENDLLIDTMILAPLYDPPPYEINGRFTLSGGDMEKWYSLDKVAERMGLEGKTDDIKRLAKEFSETKDPDFSAIPIDEPRYHEYLTGDVNALRNVFEKMPMTDYARREMRLFGRLSSSIALTGFRVDTDLVDQRLAENAVTAKRCTDWLAEKYDVPLVDGNGKPAKDVTATKGGKEALAEAFRACKANPDRWPRDCKTPTGALSYGKESLGIILAKAQEKGMDDLVELCEAIMDMKGLRSVYGTVAKYMVDGRVHPSIFPFQSSGRLSITRPGLTVFGKREGRHTERAIFLPEPGELLVAADLSQVDQRAVAAHCQDKGYMRLFEPGRDAHTEVALAVWGDAGRRDDAKILGHAWNYGASVERLANMEGVTERSAIEFNMRMQETYPHLVEWRDGVRKLAESGELLDNGFGRKMRPNPSSAWTQGPALMGQGTARDLMMEVVLRLPREVVPMMRAIVHDEVVFSIPEDDVVEVSAAIKDAFTWEWRGVPILTEVSKPGRNWAEVYEK